MDEQDFPRVIVISATPFDRTTNTGITLSNLFEGWPKERLAQIYTLDREPAEDVCTRYLQVPVKRAPGGALLRQLLTKRGLSAIQATAASAALPTAGTRSAIVARLYAEMRAGSDLSRLRAPRGLHPWVREFRPDVVYSVLGGVRMMRLSVAVAREAGCPLVPHFMDDWPSTMYTRGELLGLARRSAEASLREVLKVSPVGMGISQAMADEYAHRYGRPFAAFGNSVEESAFAAPVTRPSPTDHSSARPVRFVYVGGLHLNRWRPLIDIASALQDLDPEARLVIHSPDGDLQTFGDVLNECPSIQLAGSVSGDAVAGVLKTADALVHIESFDDRNRRYTRLSMSTKIPQYMAAGRPILAYGPGDLASMQHIETARAGVVVRRDDRNALAKAVAGLAADTGLRDELGANGYQFARSHHAQPLVAARLVDYLWRAASSADLPAPNTVDGRCRK